MKIKLANGMEIPIVMCYNHGRRFINGETRECRDIVIKDDAISLDELKVLLLNPDNLSVIELTTKRIVEVVSADETVSYEEVLGTSILENFTHACEIKDCLNGEIVFTLGEKTALELEHEEAMRAIDALLIAMEV